jgi:hypothetical protein
MISWLFQFGVLALLSIALASRTHLDPKRAPRDAARAKWKSWRGWASLAFYLFAAWLVWQARELFLIALMTACAMWYLWEALTHALPNDRDAAWNYFYDPGHCGKCGYDVRQTARGLCPECAWKIPGSAAEVRLERQSWEAWSRRWPIDYLANWRQTRGQQLGAVGFWGAALALMFVLGDGWMSAMYAWMFLNSTINVVRVQLYGRREKPLHPQGEPSSRGAAPDVGAAAGLVQPLEGRRS